MRKSWDEYFMDIAVLVAERSTCMRRQVGAVAVRDKRILATGYNGAPPGHEHCLDIGCYRQQNNIPSGEQLELCRAVHAEANVVAQCARFGMSLENSVIYLYGGTPCSSCAKLLITAGIKQIYCNELYPDSLAMDLLKISNVYVDLI